MTSVIDKVRFSLNRYQVCLPVNVSFHQSILPVDNLKQTAKAVKKADYLIYQGNKSASLPYHSVRAYLIFGSGVNLWLSKMSFFRANYRALQGNIDVNSSRDCIGPSHTIQSKAPFQYDLVKFTAPEWFMSSWLSLVTILSVSPLFKRLSSAHFL